MFEKYDASLDKFVYFKQYVHVTHKMLESVHLAIHLSTNGVLIVTPYISLSLRVVSNSNHAAHYAPIS